jgi:hypothetical protein
MQMIILDCSQACKLETSGCQDQEFSIAKHLTHFKHAKEIQSSKILEYVPSIIGLSPGPGLTVNGQCLISAWMLASWNLRPIKRFASKTVLMGFMATYDTINM